MTAWAVAADLKARPGMASISDPQATAAIEAATELLDRLTRFQYGLHDDVVRPEGCGRSCDPGAPSTRATVGWGLAAPLARVVGPWPLPGPYGGMADYCPDCGTGWGQAVTLQRPVTAVSEVRVNGSALVAGTDYQLWDGCVLLRVGGVWPSCQNLTADPATDPDTFQVSYTHGVPVPGLGVQAVLSVAAELAKWWGWADGDCKLPKRLTSISRQGVSAVVLDPMTLIQDGGTGLPDADLFIYKSNKAPQRGRIATPGVSSELRRRTV